MSDWTQETFPRRFVPAEADMGDWDQIEPLFDQLDTRPIDTLEQFESWLEDQSELAACLSQEGAARYVAMTCATDDAEKEQAHLYFVEQIRPRCKPRWHRLHERYVAAGARKDLPQDRYAVYDRSVATAVALFREANVALQVEEEKLDQRHQKIAAAMTVHYDGAEQTLQQMARYLQQPDRGVRQEAWALTVNRRLADREALDAIFEAMIRLRHRIARNAGLATFREYQFKHYERFDYAPADCLAFHAAIEKHAVPAARRLDAARKQTLGVATLRPWDMAVDPHNRPPLKPFTDPEALCRKVGRVFARIDPQLGEQFAAMVAAGWLDLASRKGKAPGGYQETFDQQRRPFIFMNAVGLQRDVETLLHEGGHAFHAIAARHEPLVRYRHAGMEMAEVASMGMELLAYDHYDEFYAGEELERARREILEGIVAFFPWMATIDAFQHWLYAHPEHTRDQRTGQWLALRERFGGLADYRGYESAREAAWQRQLHLFSVPFYYVEYGIAQIGALQLWRNARADRAQALARYRAALALGGSRPLPALWEAAGLDFDFSEATLAPLIEMVEGALAALPQ